MFDLPIQLRITVFVPTLLFFNDPFELLALQHDLSAEFMDILNFCQTIESFARALQLAVEVSGFLRENSNGIPKNLNHFPDSGFALEQILPRPIEVLLADLQAFGRVLRKF